MLRYIILHCSVLEEGTVVTPKIILIILSITLLTSCATSPNTGLSAALPTVTPLAFWNDIPVYPKSSELSEEDKFYIYTVQENVQNIETFYTTKMAADGWEKFQREDMVINHRQEITLYFSKAEKILTVHILNPIPDEPTKVAIKLEE